MTENGRRPIIPRRVDVGAIELARLERGLSLDQLCRKAGVDTSSYRNLIKNRGERSRTPLFSLKSYRCLGFKSGRWSVSLTWPGGQHENLSPREARDLVHGIPRPGDRAGGSGESAGYEQTSRWRHGAGVIPVSDMFGRDAARLVRRLQQRLGACRQ